MILKGKKSRLIIVSLAVIASPALAQEKAQSEREAMYYRYLDFASYVKGGSITPHWMADGSSFWYTEGAPASTIIYKVDPKANTKTPLFDTVRLRKALTPLLGHEPPYQGLPFADFIFMDSEKAVKFAVEDKEFILQLDAYTIKRAAAVSEEEKTGWSRRLCAKVSSSLFRRLWSCLRPTDAGSLALRITTFRSVPLTTGEA